ncbi:Lactate utilization protein C [Polystyrenella longa]|uniref:Lactate utilization protein C n=1 Tax=Polystyrenella longa TaxID=2528007 RepID=A0A518CI32_9PLAN|nr:LUD domain-containing protein [Polystyrenella longa]QDU78885.1 Lactate utilization protein C [Polystyrenella longa]
MSSRDKILKSINRHLVPAAPLPDMDQAWIQFDNPTEQFLTMLSAVGGRGEVVANLQAVSAKLHEEPFYDDAKQICSLVPNLDISADKQVDLNAIEDPHDLADIDFAIVPGEFAVAENGAIWVTDAQVKHKALYFIAQHVVIVVHASDILHNMHEAYPRTGLNTEAFQQTPHFGVFISGPSKTADIEQSLVIGAHGARSLRVFLVEESFDRAQFK